MARRRAVPALLGGGLVLAMLLTSLADGSASASSAGASASASASASPGDAIEVDLSGCVGTAAIECTVDVDPGTYRVTAVLGSASVMGSTALRVEARRQVIPETVTAIGEEVERSVAVDVRDPEGQPSSTATGGDGLTLTFVGASPQVASVTVTPLDTGTTTLFLAGDSTVCDQGVWPYTG